MSLFMLWPTAERPEPLDLRLDPDYSIRTYQPGDQHVFLELMGLMDFDLFDAEKLTYNVARILPDGWFFAIHQATGAVVGTAMCLHNYTGHTPFGGDVGWLACRPEHTGVGLGYSLTAAVTNRFLAAGYTRIQLGTEDHRLPAIKTYLKLGYRPVLYSPAMHQVWATLCQRLDWPWTPAEWYSGFLPSALGED
jgi:mycothiol synthase